MTGASGTPHHEPDPHLATGTAAAHALPDAESAGFQQHLAGCPTCATEYNELSATAARLGAAAGSVTPPPDLRDRVLAAAGRTPQLPPSIVASDPPRHRRAWPARPAGRLAVAAALVLMAGGITWAVVGGGDEPSLTASEQMQQCVATDDTAADMMPMVGDSGMVERSDSCSAVLIHLPAMTPPQNQRYQLWMQTDTGTRPLGTVPMPAADSGSPSGEPMISLPAPMESGDQAVLVTMEPMTGSASPTGDPLWMVPLH